MAATTVTDYVIWARHIHGDAALTREVASMHAGQMLCLRVDGVIGDWRKMDDGKDGRPVSGIRPLGAAQAAWRTLFRDHKGAVVTLERIGAYQDLEVSGMSETSIPFRHESAKLLARNPVDRAAALTALLAGGEQGWRSEGRTVTRDEMHER